ncbi:MAG: NUDIX domain-containing protein [archaeon]
METYDFNRPTHYTVSAFVVDNGMILLLKQERSPYWLLPGGHIEDTELPHEAIIREVFEETGLKIELLEKIDEKSRTNIVTPQPIPYQMRLLPCRNKRDLDFVFTAKVVSGKLKIDSESKEAKWFTKEELLKDLDVGPYTKHYSEKLLQISPAVSEKGCVGNSASACSTKRFKLVLDFGKHILSKTYFLLRDKL